MIDALQAPLSPQPNRWIPAQVAVVCAVPLALLGLWWVLLAAKGPYWLASNLDPDYVYLLNGLNILHGHAPAHVDHPGTPLQVLLALIIKLTHLMAGSGALADDVIARPEFYLLAVNGMLLVALAGALVVAGLAALRTTGSLVAGLAIQLLPGLDPIIGSHVVCVKPEPFLAALTALVAALVLRRLVPGRQEGRVPDSALFGLLVGLAMATKVSAAPLAVLPLLLLPGLRSRALFAGVTAVTIAIGTLPAWSALTIFGDFIGTIATHSGQYGSGKAAVFDRAEYVQGLHLLVSGRSGAVFVAVVAVGALVSLALAWKVRRGGDTAAVVTRRALLASLTMQVASLLVVARHPARHYMVPALVISGLTAAVTLHGLRLLQPVAVRWARWGAVTLSFLLMLAAVRFAWGVPARMAGLVDLRVSQLSVGAQLRELFPGARVVHYYPSSSPAYALHFGDMYTDAKWSRQVNDRYPRHLYYNLWNDRLEVYVPQPAGSTAKPLDFGKLTSEVLCGTGDEGPVVFQGSLLQVVPSTVQDVQPLGARLELVYSAGAEGLYRPVVCGPDGSAPKRHSRP
jgi:hypothetical protein